MSKLARFRPGSTAPLRQAIGDLPRGTAQARAYPGRAGATGQYWLGTEGASDDVVSGLSQAAEQAGAVIEPVMIEVGLQQLRDDQFQMVLAQDGPRRVNATLTVDVGYVHAGRWTIWSDAVSCTI